MFNDKSKHAYTYEDVLMNAIGFNEVDLDLNSQGVLSDPQILWLRGQRNWYGLWTLLLMGAFIIAFRVFGASLFSGDGCVATLFVGVLGGVALAGCFTQWYNSYQDMSKNRAEVVEAHMVLDIKSAGKNGVVYVAKMDAIEFTVQKEVFLAFKNGEPYRLYYTPNTKRILSAEWLR